MKKICIVIGTRPEAIKMGPLINKLKTNKKLKVTLCVTGQHKEMLYQALSYFEINPDYDLSIMKPGQDLFDITSKILINLRSILKDITPDLVLVHGDTTTALAAALSSYYLQIPIGHIEAGLRTNDIYSPFPEEANRSIISKIAKFNFAPTLKSKLNLLKEGVSESDIFVTGNTVIDALFHILNKIEKTSNKNIEILKNKIDFSKKIILVTGHRRENFGEPLENICKALLEIAKRDEVQIIYPVHLNPQVKGVVYDMLGAAENIKLIDPLGYEEFVWLMSKSYIIITDSGGIQEEAPSLGIPVLVTRETTERPEAIESGTAFLVGSDYDLIVNNTNKLLNSKAEYNLVSSRINPFGEGDSSDKIQNIILKSI